MLYYIMNILGSLQNVCKYNSVAPAVGTCVASSLSGNYTQDPAQFALSGYTVYKFYNTTAQPTTNAAATNQTGSFTLTISNATKTVYYLICGGGSGAASGTQGGGGGAAGNLIFGSISLPVGTYNCTYQIGGCGGGGNYVSSGSYSNGANGYGCYGGDSNFVCNSVTYTSNGGGPGGPSQNSNGATGFACSGGAGCSIGTGTHTASSGSVHTGGSSPSSTYCSGAGGGSSPYENGSNGSAGNANAGHAASGGIGGRATRNIDLTGTPWTGFSSTEYFCEGGSGACARTAISSDTIAPINSYYGYGGKGSGVPDNSPTNRCTNALSTSFGCGGGGSFQAMGVGSGYYAGCGSNGLFLLAFA
jgi:hypothetical protein